MLKADFSVGQEILSDPVLRVLINKSNPVVLVTVLHPLELTPMVTHHFLVVVCDERFEDLCLLSCASVDFGKQSIDKQFFDDDHRLLAPDLRTRHVQSMPQANLNLVHQ